MERTDALEHSLFIEYLTGHDNLNDRGNVMRCELYYQSAIPQIDPGNIVHPGRITSNDPGSFEEENVDALRKIC